MTNVIKAARGRVITEERESSQTIDATTTPPSDKRRAAPRAIIIQQAIWPTCFVALTLALFFLLAQPARALLYHQLPPMGLEAPGAVSQRPIEYQLIGEAGQPIRLPCLIGKQLYCGEPYFIAWYKLNVSSKSWVRFEHRSMETSDTIDTIESGGQNQPSSSSVSGKPLANRVRFDWSAGGGGGQSPKQQPTTKSANFKSSICSDPAILHSSIVNNPRRTILGAEQAGNFDCAQLTISALELSDEAQYKCDITFSESLDFDKCPATTLSQLTVIARPNEPELLVNGRKTGPGSGGSSNWPAFKEGSQVKLECQSGGGKPAPRIEWLNVSETEERVHLMRDFWPQKRTSFLLQDNGSPVTSSSLTVSLSRFDLHSQFVCLVLSQQPRGQQQQQPVAHYSLEQLVKNPVHLLQMLRAGSASSQQQLQSLGLMFKRIKLDVQVRPSSVSLIVRDVYSSPSSPPSSSSSSLSPSTLLEPVQFVGYDSASSPIGAPFYSLQLNRLYAIQCLVEQSRPQSQVSWFNRSAPIEVETLELNSSSSSPYFIVPNELAQLSSVMRPNYNNPPHRVSSFVRHELLPDGASFRTTATLLLTTSLWDNFEELSCRISNEAFQLEELPQAAPIRLFVNYAPFAWLELDSTRIKQQQQQHQQQQIDLPTGWLTKVQAPTDGELSLRCSVAANPLGQNTILQIDWLKDGRKLQQPAQISSLSSSSSLSNKQQALSVGKSRLQIERANHLHMPLAGASAGSPIASGKNGPNQLVSGSKLIGSSWLSISALNKSDSGNYTCQFKLIPAPPSSAGQTHPNQASARSEIRITSGQANQTVQLNVIEAKASAPTIKISAERGVFVYWLASDKEQRDDGRADGEQSDEDGRGERRRRLQTAVLDSLDGQLSLRCELPNHQSGQQQQLLSLAQAGHKVLWFANKQPIQSSQPQETLNTSLGQLLAGLGLGQRPTKLIVTCAHQMLSPAGQHGLDFHAGSSMRIFESSNALDIRLKVGPRMLERRELLMPQMRSFSELELSANPANKLRLVCLAQCEPLCSIEWHLNQEPLVAAAFAAAGAAASTPAAAQELLSANNRAGLVNQSVNLGVEGFVERRELQAASLPWLKLASIENVIHQPASDTHHAERNTSSIAGTSFSWLRQASLGAIGAHPTVQQQLDWLGRQLMREAGEQQHSPDQVNVFSRLELSYNSIGRLLEASRLADLGPGGTRIKCRINPIFDSSSGFEHTHLGPNQWSSEPHIRPGGKSITRPTNLSSLFPPPAPSGHQLSSLGAADKRLSFVDEMQISLALDRGPASVSIWFAGVLSTDLEPNGVTLSESQLIELADPNRAAPLLQCKVLGHSPQPAVKFKWTFVDWNNTELAIGSEGPQQQQLNLRQLIELRQSQLNVEPMSALGLDVILSSIVGNYTCTASNIHGSKSATLPIRIQGRPLCKLSLANQLLGPANELLANLRCSIYSVPPLIETIWLRNEQQLAVMNSNKTTTLSAGESSSVVTQIDLPVMVLNGQQEFLLADLLPGNGGGGGGSLKCVARNSLGFSEACELDLAGRQMLLNTLRPFGNGGASMMEGKNSPLSMVLFPGGGGGGGGSGGLVVDSSHGKQSSNLLPTTNQTNYHHSNIDTRTTTNANQTPASGRSVLQLNHLLRFDWILIVCSSLAGLWLLFILSSAFARRKFKLASSSSGSPSADRNHHTSWRFNSSSSRSNSNNEIVGVVPFQGSKVCVNYYGGSNGDSEHEMIQSGSQSSHYEDFVQHQLQLKQQQQQQRLTSQPVYLNGLSTLNNNNNNNRPMKSSLSSSSTYDSSTISRLGVKKLLSHTVLRSDQLSGAGSSSFARPQQQSASTMRNSFVGPLVNGSNTSRVNLDQQQQQQLSVARQYHHSRQALRGGQLEQQLYGNRNNEHIYDDVIYNQMIL